jgi:hypothetical protein
MFSRAQDQNKKALITFIFGAGKVILQNVSMSLQLIAAIPMPLGEWVKG